jgi:hypothetical protein
MVGTSHAAARRLAAPGPRPRPAVFDADPQLARQLRPSALTDLNRQRVGVLARADYRRRKVLAEDILTALGVHSDASGAARDEGLDWLLAHAWLAAHQVRDLIIGHVEWLSPALITEVALLAAGTGSRLWLLTEPSLNDAQHETLTSWQPGSISWRDFAAQFPDVALFTSAATADDAGTGAPVAGPEHGFPTTLPAEDFPTFRAACRRVLAPAQFAQVDALLAAKTARLARHLDEHPDATTPPAIADYLHQCYRNLPTETELLTATRAAQIVLFTRGWFLQVDTAGLLATAADTPRPGARTPHHWRRLGVYRQPHRGSICALAAADLDLTQMAGLTIADVAEDGSSITIDGRQRSVETGAQVYLRAQLPIRGATGATPGSPLLTRADGQPLAARAMADIINQARTDTGLAVTSRRVARERPRADRWFTRWGVSLQPLTGKEPNGD